MNNAALPYRGIYVCEKSLVDQSLDMIGLLINIVYIYCCTLPQRNIFTNRQDWKIKWWIVS